MTDDQATRAAMLQARGALLLDAMVDENGVLYGTTIEALDALDTALAPEASSAPSAGEGEFAADVEQIVKDVTEGFAADVKRILGPAPGNDGLARAWLDGARQKINGKGSYIVGITLEEWTALDAANAAPTLLAERDEAVRRADHSERALVRTCESEQRESRRATAAEHRLDAALAELKEAKRALAEIANMGWEGAPDIPMRRIARTALSALSSAKGAGR